MNRSRDLVIHSEEGAKQRLLVLVNLLTALLVLFTLAGCGGGQEQAEVPAETVEVKLAGHDIDMPASVHAGPTTFEVTNGGDSIHGFEVEGLGLEEEIEQIPPGETRTLEVNLEPGTYRVYCPVSDHGRKGMELPLKVIPREEAT
ncbi:MAG TPA: cupredoxin domain-containing protein [Thermoanaerobaculia bacterium]|nr:cupredoxin domain-containing protein [Thermoanaerobaculia bacterium]